MLVPDVVELLAKNKRDLRGIGTGGSSTVDQIRASVKRHISTLTDREQKANRAASDAMGEIISLRQQVDVLRNERNIFLDGNTWKDSRSVDKKPLVGDLQAGLAITINGTRIAYTHVIRSKEFDGQDQHDEFGALSVSFNF